MGFIDFRVGNKSIVLADPKLQIVKRGFAIDNEIVLGSYTMPMGAPVCTPNEEIFGHQYLLQSSKSTPVIENVDFYLGGILESRGYILLLNANSKEYRFSFIYKPISNTFYNRQLRDITWDNTKFWRGWSLPVNYTEYMDFLDDVVQNVDSYVPGGDDTFCLYPVKCPNWNQLPDGVGQTDGFETSNTKRRLNLFNAAANVLVRNFVEVTHEDGGSGINHDISATYISDAINDQKITPFIYTAFLLEEIWRLEGWKVAGNLFEHEDFLRDTLINSFALDKYAPCGAILLEWDNTAFTVGAKLPVISNYQFSSWYNNGTKIVNIPSAILISSAVFPCIMVALNIEFYFVADVTGRTITIELYDEVFGTSIYVGSGIGVGNVVAFTVLSRDGSVTAGMNIDTDFSYRIQSTDIPAPDQVLSRINGKIYLTDKEGFYFSSNVLDIDFEYKNHIPDLSVGEFVKSIVKRFGCFYDYDFSTKTVYYNIVKENLKSDAAYDITSIVEKDSYEKDILNFFIKGKYANEPAYAYDTSTHTEGVENAYTEQFLFDIPGSSLTSTTQGTYKLPIFGTSGASKQLQRNSDEGLIYLHFKGLQVGSDGLYPSPYASASNLMSNGAAFSDYDMRLSYMIPTYWRTYLRAKANPVRFNLINTIVNLHNLNMFKLVICNYQKYFPEEMIVGVDDEAIKSSELKVYQL